MIDPFLDGCRTRESASANEERIQVSSLDCRVDGRQPLGRNLGDLRETEFQGHVAAIGAASEVLSGQ